MKATATLLLLLAASAVAIGQNADAEKSKIVALENAWNLAEQHKDVKALDELLSNNLSTSTTTVSSRIRNSFWRMRAGRRSIRNRS